MRLGTLPDATYGFDCNTTVSFGVAKRFFDRGYRFVVRYVRRTSAHAYDLTTAELNDILAAGLALMVVQHVADPNWSPTKALGRSYGAVAASEAKRVGVPIGVQLWCDLEGVSESSTASEVIDYCNAWYDEVKAAGFDPGLYVGDSCGLTATELYARLKFRRYWQAYNINRDCVPAVRGVCMKQKPYPPQERRIECGFKYDEDFIVSDAMGGTPVVMLP